jgi:hypothetical protein
VSKHEVFAILAICDSAPNGKRSRTIISNAGSTHSEALAKLQGVLSKDGLLRAFYDLGYFAPTTPPVSAQLALHRLLLPMKDASLDEVPNDQARDYLDDICRDSITGTDALG